MQIKDEVKQWLRQHPGYQKKNAWVASTAMLNDHKYHFNFKGIYANSPNVWPNMVKECQKELRREVKGPKCDPGHKGDIGPSGMSGPRCLVGSELDTLPEDGSKGKEYMDKVREAMRFLHKEGLYDINPDSHIKVKKDMKKIEPFTGGNPDNVLIIGDLHSPWILEGYLEFNRALQEKYNCGTVIFIGDVIDSHAWSFHQHNPDGMSVNDELQKAIDVLQRWYHTFPVAQVLFGNHDLLVARKAMEVGLSKRFIKDFGDIIEAPKTWEFTHEVIKDNVKYIHGSIGDAFKRCKDERVSLVQGHLHSQAFIQWAVSERDAIFGLQVGCGIDRQAYAFEYASPMAKKPVISSAVVLEHGTLPILELMKL